MKTLLLGFLVSCTCLGSAADFTVITRRAQELNTLLTPALQREQASAARTLPRVETPAPPEDLNRELENRAWREENLAERHDQTLFSEPPRAPVSGSVPNGSTATRVQQALHGITLNCRTLGTLRQLESRWHEAGNTDRVAEMRQRQARVWELLHRNVRELTAQGERLVARRDRAEFRRLTRELAAACTPGPDDHAGPIAPAAPRS